jgi:cytochrome c oxidase assembly protein subunit 15
MNNTEFRKVYYFALFAVIFTFLLILAGSLVMSTGAGMTIPTWPLPSHFFPPFKGVLWFEYGHRILAGTDAVLTLILVISLWRFNFSKGVKWLGITALGAVFAQALLGGITVLYGLPFDVSTAHAALAQVFFCLMVCLAYFTSGTSVKLQAPGSRIYSLKVLTLTTPLLIYVQILLGAFARHLGTGLAISTFPLAFGQVFPPGLDMSFGVMVNFLHTRIGALLVLFFVSGTSWLGWGFANLRKICQINIILVVLQVFLGIGVVLTGKSILFTTAHVGVGTLLLALNFLLAIKVRMEFNPQVSEAVV